MFTLIVMFVGCVLYLAATGLFFYGKFHAKKNEYWPYTLGIVAGLGCLGLLFFGITP